MKTEAVLERMKAQHRHLGIEIARMQEEVEREKRVARATPLDLLWLRERGFIPAQ